MVRNQLCHWLDDGCYVTNYSIGWRKYIINHCLEFDNTVECYQLLTRHSFGIAYTPGPLHNAPTSGQINRYRNWKMKLYLIGWQVFKVADGFVQHWIICGHGPVG